MISQSCGPPRGDGVLADLLAERLGVHRRRRRGTGCRAIDASEWARRRRGAEADALNVAERLSHKSHYSTHLEGTHHLLPSDSDEEAEVSASGTRWCRVWSRGRSAARCVGSSPARGSWAGAA